MLETDSLRIDWCSVDRLPELQAFIGSRWREGHIFSRDSELLRWQYPFPGDDRRLSVLIADDPQGIVGMLGIIPFQFSVRGRSFPGAWLTMWLSASPKGSGQVGLRLLRRVLKEEGYGFVGTLGGNEITQKILGAFGFSIWEAVPRWVRVVTPTALSGLLTDAKLYPSKTVAQLCAVKSHEPNSANGNFRIIAWNEDVLARWDQAWEKLFAPHLIGTRRDSRYLRHRYLNSPHFQYQLQFVEDVRSSTLQGLLVYRIEPVLGRPEKILRVVEFLSTELAGSMLAQFVLEAAEAEKVAFADFYCTSEQFAAALETAGFVREDQLPAPLPNRFQPLDQNRSSLTAALWVSPRVAENSVDFFRDRSALYFTRADCDQDRPN